MGRRPFTPEERAQAKIKARIVNDLWKQNNKEKFDEYQKSYYLKNKEHLDEMKKILRQKNKEKKEAKQAIIDAPRKN